MFVIHPATTEQDVREARALFLEYASMLGVDLEFQDFSRELAELPGGYAPPKGALLLAVVGKQHAGCVALKALDEPGVCELKRLYLRPEHRGQGYGHALLHAAFAEALRLGYERMRLDTLPTMSDAIRLYESHGFRDIAPYRDNPVAGARWLEVALDAEDTEEAET
jgi:putative acetyltransferase